MIFYILGCALLIVAFVSAAYETVARIEGHHGGVFMSAYDLWYTMWPGSLTQLRIIVERDLGPFFWDPVLVSLLILPGWLLLGGPGIYLLIRFRPRQADVYQLEEDSLYVLERLAKQAKEDGYDETPEDVFTDHELEWDPSQDEDSHPDIRRPGEIPKAWQAPPPGSKPDPDEQ